MVQFQRMDSVFIPVSDVEKSAKWYGETFGFRLERQDTTWKYYSLRAYDEGADFIPWFTLYEVREVQPAAHMAFNLYTPDGVDLHQTLKAKGVPVSEMIDTGGMIVFEVFDPDANRIGIVSWQE